MNMKPKDATKRMSLSERRLAMRNPSAAAGSATPYTSAGTMPRSSAHARCSSSSQLTSMSDSSTLTSVPSPGPMRNTVHDSMANAKRSRLDCKTKNVTMKVTAKPRIGEKMSSTWRMLCPFGNEASASSRCGPLSTSSMSTGRDDFIVPNNTALVDAVVSGESSEPGAPPPAPPLAPATRRIDATHGPRSFATTGASALPCRPSAFASAVIACIMSLAPPSSSSSSSLSTSSSRVGSSSSTATTLSNPSRRSAGEPPTGVGVSPDGVVATTASPVAAGGSAPRDAASVTSSSPSEPRDISGGSMRFAPPRASAEANTPAVGAGAT
mmetsp:Transcript_18653/g.65911  ORF Transcript_18653/g.65911 Transcript_18653/m.65911 type:complete len:325 (+) Transcript_18653:328-1302(+)